MKLLRYGPKGAERPGVIDSEGHIRDLSDHIDDITPAVLETELPLLAALDPETLPPVQEKVRVGVPVANVGKIVCAGLNYRKHAAEIGKDVPTEPVLFMKATTAINGPYDDVKLPRGSTKADWEVELAVVIGATARYVDEVAAMAYVAGFCCANDVSERAFQMEHGGQWVKGKSADTFAPLGPWLVTADAVADAENLHLWLEVNGYRYQDGHTHDFVFTVPALISYISRFMTLEAGDVLLTGTPAGVGAGQTPPVFLKPGDVIHLGIDGLGEQRHAVIASD